jgi:site-specific DNA-methyltransferase (adenine-specific)
MKPYFETPDGRITIYCGDCREVLPTLTEPVDLVLTDPPYGVRYVTARRSRNDPLVAPIAGDESLDVMADALPLVDGLLRMDRHAYLFAAPSRIGEAADIVSRHWKVKNILAWDKGDRGTVGDLEAGYAACWEAIVYANKGRRALRGSRPRSVIRHDWSSTDDPVHPTVKPVPMLRRLIERSTEPDELVLDPFGGSGTTMRACMDLGRRGVMIEIEERYCEIAARRLSQQVLPLEDIA